MTQAPSDQASGTSRSRPLVLPEVFNGDGQFDDWVSHFESLAAVNGWGDEDKLLWLRVRLTGKAHVAYNRLAHETQGNYSATKAALRERFEPPSKRQLYKVEFESRRSRAKNPGQILAMNSWCWHRKRFRHYKMKPEKSWR